MSTALRVNELIKALGLSVYKFEREINVGASTINKALLRNTGIKQDTLDKISKTYPNVSVEWLRSGSGEMFINAENPPQGQVSEDKVHYATPTSLDLLIKANADQSQAGKDLAAAHVKLVTMAEEEKKRATGGGAQHTSPAFFATREDLLDAVLEALMLLGYDSAEARRAKEHIAAKETVK